MYAKYFTLVLAVLCTLTCLRVRADYASAAAQVDAQEQASRQAQEQIDGQRYESLLAQDNARFANCHGGFASFSPSNHEFSTNDGWECEYTGSSMGCANAQLGQKFRAFAWPWRPGVSHISRGDVEAITGCFFKSRARRSDRH